MKGIFDPPKTKVEVFEEKLYRALRSYQDGNFNSRGAGTVVGQLDQPLTRLYDAIRLAAYDLRPKRS